MSEQSAILRRTFDQLVGASIVDWIGSEMAHGEAPVVWRSPSVPFVQLTMLDVQLASGRTIRFLSQLDTQQGFYGLYFRETDGLPSCSEPEPESICRVRRLTELPIGSVASVEARAEEGENVTEVRISIGGELVALLAGEVYEQWGGTFRVALPDECILVRIGNSDV